MAGMPSINIIFKMRGVTVNRRSGQGTVAIIVKDALETLQGLHVLYAAADIPTGLGVANREYIAQAFVGNINRPAKVIVYVLPEDATDYAEALDELAMHAFDWLAAPPDVTPSLAEEIRAWVRAQRDEQHRVYKAVLPHNTANDEAIVNFITDGITANDVVTDAAGYCSRIVGMIAGTPLVQSVTYAVLEEVSDVERMTNAQMDTAVDEGKFLLFHDGVKVKTGRGVTSLVTVPPNKSAQLKKIKIVEALDLINYDLRILLQDNYIGKVENSYDNKCVLITATQDYLRELEDQGILQAGQTSVTINIDKQRAYLRESGVDVSKLTEQQIKEYNTDTKVFLSAKVRVLDAVEDIDLEIEY